jgi:tripartite-type tricarboxylate transporter receptor subunit TctC
MRTLCAALTSAAVLSFAAGAAAQTSDDFPNRPIRIIVPQAASGVDLQVACSRRRWAALGPAVVDIAPAPTPSSDGRRRQHADYIAGLCTDQLGTETFIYKKLPYDPLRDFAPITQTTENPLGAVVNPASGIRSIKDIVERAKANPGQVNYGSFGIGNMTHLMGVLLSIAADIKMTHVPYRGQTPAITEC